MKKKIEHILNESLSIHDRILKGPQYRDCINRISALCIECYKNKGKVLFCGNGGSAADAQHLAAELSGRFFLNRAPLFAEALHVNSSYLTAVANDFNFEEVFARLIEAKGSAGDVLIAISTSGNSENIVRACKKAKERNMKVVGLSGAALSKMSPYCDIQFLVPSQNTARIQEIHILVGHIICELVESTIFGDRQSQ